KRERDGVQRIQRESRQHEERAAGPATQFTHHETTSTQGRHTTPAATHHAGEEDIHHHLPQLIPAAPGKWQKHRGHHTSHTMSKRTLIHDAAPKISCHPALNGRRCPTQRSHTRCITHAGKETRAAHSLPSLLLMATEEDNSRHTQLPACTAKEALKSTAMCILCVVVCACSNTKQRREKGAEYVEGSTKMYRGDAWQKQQLEEDHSNS
ncbi:hypothetical protein TCSYLVIO_008478, partial [Trypanosoma cruzi]